jgi:glyoxylase-like metal-dependent hydrolase (beta-lactamase superfamily II)
MAAPVPFTLGLHEVAPGTFAYLQPDGGWGRSNAGLVVGEGASLLVDTLFDLPLTRAMLGAMAPALERSPLRVAVNTHANGDHCFGNELLGPDVTIHAAPEAVTQMRTEGPGRLADLTDGAPALGDTLGSFVADALGPYEFHGITTRLPDVTITDDTVLDVGGRRVELMKLGPAHTTGDVAVHVPDAGVVYAGDLLFIGGTPIMWAGPTDSWIAALDALLATGARWFVPGHGPVVGADGVEGVQGYLRHVDAEARRLFAAGLTAQEAALGLDLRPFAHLRDAERTVVNVEAVYRHLDPARATRDVPALFAGMAQWRAARALPLG